MKSIRIHPILVGLLLIASLLSGCAQTIKTPVPTPIPAEFLPTAIALTLQASGVGLSTPHPSPSPKSVSASLATPLITADVITATETTVPTKTTTPTPTATATAKETDVATAEIIPTLVITASVPLQPTTTQQATVSATSQSLPPPEIPDANIQIYRLGELSLVTSPIDLTARLTSLNGKVVRVELFGEDGRLLARHVRTFPTTSWQVAKIGISLDFEIRSTAEEGRLVVSMEDDHGRLIDVNSVHLILLSQGVTELNPATALWQRIIIQEPAPKALIQGGSLIVSGRAKPDINQPIKVLLIGEDGKILGQRLASLSTPIPGDYGNFIAEVPYNVTEMTPALLVVLEDDGKPSDIAHLSSQPVVLAP